MEKTIIRTIREAFKKAYINKLIKESAENMAKDLSPEEFRNAENLYKLFVSGKIHPELISGKDASGKDVLGYFKTNRVLTSPKGKKVEQAVNTSYNRKMLNYAIEKAIEEYRSTKDTKIKDAIVSLYNPKISKLVLNTLKKQPGVISNLKSAYGQAWESEFENAAGEAWLQAVGEPEAFNDIIDSYTTDNPDGIGAVIMSRMKQAIQKVSSLGAAKKRGGAGSGKYVPKECQTTLNKIIINPNTTEDGGRLATQSDQMKVAEIVNKIDSAKLYWSKNDKHAFIPEEDINKFIEEISAITDMEDRPVFSTTVTDEKKQGTIPNCVEPKGQRVSSLDDPNFRIAAKGGARFSDAGDSDDTGSDTEVGFDVDPVEFEDQPESGGGSENQNLLRKMTPEKLRKTFNEIGSMFQEDPNLREAQKLVMSRMFLDGMRASDSYQADKQYFERAYPHLNPISARNTTLAIPAVLLRAPNELEKGGTPYYYKANEIGVKNGLPEGWLKLLISNGKLVDIAKFLKNPTGLNESYDRVLFNLIMGIDTDKILKEVYKRLGLK